ncbi:MAG: Holliday junction branch migration protein RuvA [Clostridia bacterium]|nr:Holliday junction branch migration protein RuvA [Clostridia bacterium]
MIGYVQGKVLEVYSGAVLLESNGIGFEITVSASAFARLTKGMQGGVYTYLNVTQENSTKINVALFGFDTKEEKDMFLKLTSVNSVGAKMGMNILSALSLKDLAVAIATSDTKTLSSVKGLGKKTAERIILELREKVSSLDLGDVPSVTPATGSDGDAVIALMSLGFSRSESEKSVSAAKTQGAFSVEEVIALALKNMAK